MADKDEFKFDDDDAFPETDLSSAFSEGEQSAPEEPDYPMTVKKTGGARTRILQLVLLLVIAGGGAAYYFLMMEEPAPPPPPPKKKVVAVAPKPAPAPAPATAPAPPAPPAPGAAAVPAAKPVTVTVAPPPPVPAPAPATVTAPAPAKPATAAIPPPPKAAVTPAPPAASVPVAAPAPVPAAKPAVTSGPWQVEAGTYMNAAELKVIKKKIRGLGYEPQVSTMQKTVRMTRLRIGSYPESEVKEALAYARGIAPGAFALRAGETSTVYAGTFTSAENIRQMTERFSGEGVNVEEESVEVKRTISLVRFGGFPDQAAADKVAVKARRAGIAAEVIKSR